MISRSVSTHRLRSKARSIWAIPNVYPGRYRVIATPGLPRGYYLASVLHGSRNVLGQVVDLQPGAQPIRVVYKPNAGTVRGTIEDGEGAMAMLIPESALSANTPEIGLRAQAGQRGAFEISSVRPGSYYLMAVEQAAPERFSSPRVLRTFISSAVAVRVEEGRQPW
jgi:hypothetical protein